MHTSERDAIRAVELAIMACEGGMVVGGIPYQTIRAADTARVLAAQRAVRESAYLRRWIAIRPWCGWCGEMITADDAFIEVNGIQVHSSNGRPRNEEVLGRPKRYCAAPPGRSLYLVQGG